MRKELKLTLSAGLSVLAFAAWAGVTCFKKFTFNEDEALKEWKTMILKGEVHYKLIKTGDEGYVQAVSQKASSALYYRVGYRITDYPFFRWKWRVLEFPDLSKTETKEERDDYAARVYVIFPFLCFSSSKFLEYVWAEDIPEGTIIDSPSGKNVKIFVVRSGKSNEQEWLSEARNVYEDYIKAFGSEPRRKAGAIAIMCDADSTQTTAKALFDDIIIEGQEGL